MSNERCKTCLFGGECRSIEGCDFYSPLDDDWDEREQYIEGERAEYYDAWIRYISGW